jgi:hypothetical protein
VLVDLKGSSFMGDILLMAVRRSFIAWLGTRGYISIPLEKSKIF